MISYSGMPTPDMINFTTDLNEKEFEYKLNSETVIYDYRTRLAKASKSLKQLVNEKKMLRERLQESEDIIAALTSTQLKMLQNIGTNNNEIALNFNDN